MDLVGLEGWWVLLGGVDLRGGRAGWWVLDVRCFLGAPRWWLVLGAVV